MKTAISLIVVVLLSFSSSFAQKSPQKKDSKNNFYNNYIGLQTGLHLVPNYFIDFPITSTFGIHFQRQVYKKAHVDISYMMWMPSR